jgi:hypothetical protein
MISLSTWWSLKISTSYVFLTHLTIFYKSSKSLLIAYSIGIGCYYNNSKCFPISNLAYSTLSLLISFTILLSPYLNRLHISLLFSYHLPDLSNILPRMFLNPCSTSSPYSFYNCSYSPPSFSSNLYPSTPLISSSSTPNHPANSAYLYLSSYFLMKLTTFI